MPAATTKNVASNTRNMLRTDHSITRFSISVALVIACGGAGAGGVAAMLRRRGHCNGRDGLDLPLLSGLGAVGTVAETGERRFEIAFGVNQEVCADHYDIA